MAREKSGKTGWFGGKSAVRRLRVTHPANRALFHTGVTSHIQYRARQGP